MLIRSLLLCDLNLIWSRPVNSARCHVVVSPRGKIDRSAEDINVSM